VRTHTIQLFVPTHSSQLLLFAAVNFSSLIALPSSCVCDGMLCNPGNGAWRAAGTQFLSLTCTLLRPKLGYACKIAS